MFKANVLFENCSCYEYVTIVNIQIIQRSRIAYSSYECDKKTEFFDEINVVYIDSDGDVRNDVIKSFDNIEKITY